MKRLPSENVDISFILRQKMINPKKSEKLLWKTTVIHGWDIKQMSLALGFLKIIILTYELFSESQLYQRKEQQLKRKTPGEQQQPDFLANRLDARFVLNL